MYPSRNGICSVDEVDFATIDERVWQQSQCGDSESDGLTIHGEKDTSLSCNAEIHVIDLKSNDIF